MNGYRTYFCMSSIFSCIKGMSLCRQPALDTIYKLVSSSLVTIKSLSDSKKVEILAHEMCHAMLDLTGWSNYLPDAVEESLCILCERFVGVLKQPFFKE